MEDTIRLSVFVGMLLIIMLCERLWPRREPTQSILHRWSINLGLVTLNSLLQRVLLGSVVYQSALIAEQAQWGLLHQFNAPEWVDIVLTLLWLDLVIYWQHRIFHRIPTLWRLHQVHHTDLDFDATTAVRFHPIEIGLSLLVKVAGVWVLGAHPLAVIGFEIILNASAIFNHGNFRIPPRVDNAVRWLLVTPDMHRIHHSVIRSETDSNFGFSISCWDRLFGSYCPVPEQGQLGMTMGLPECRDSKPLNILDLLVLPAKKSDRIKPLN